MFCTAYLNNILVYSDNKKDYVKYIKKILKKLRNTGLYLDINKCEFYVILIKYLRFIIIIKEFKIDFVKINIIL